MARAVQSYSVGDESWKLYTVNRRASAPEARKEHACERCFADQELRAWIRTNGKVGPCSWCRSRSAHRVTLEQLGPILREVAYIYNESEDDTGSPISQLLQGDWEIFSEKIEASRDLLHTFTVSILEAGLHPKDDVDEPNYRSLFHDGGGELEEEWHERIIHLLDSPERRVDDPPPVPPDDENDYIDRIQFALEDVSITYPGGNTLHRARIHKTRSRLERFGLDDLRAPPPADTPAGRANRAREPVLYLASDRPTALAEVRAWKGAAVAVASFEVIRPVNVLNLWKPLLIESPFFHDHLGWTIEVYRLFQRFAEELSRPVIPEEEGVVYIPSQAVCDVVRRAGYDGIAYPSAMGPGHNIVLFDIGAADPKTVEYLRVSDLRHIAEPMRPAEPVYDDWPYGDPE